MKVIQIGEGNFLRSFVDLYFDTLNKEGYGPYDVHIVKPISYGSLDKFYKQNNKYHVVLRGRQQGKDVENVYRVDSIKQVINPFVESDSFFALATDPEIKVLVSNTTEAGIVFNANDRMDMKLEEITYPAKLTIWLYKRFKAGLSGIYLLPVELIDNNAQELYKCVNQYIDLWNLEKEFKEWNKKENYYCNTLVDRIVSGYPKDEQTKAHLEKLIGEKDELMSVAEPFGLWVIEDKGNIKNILKDGHHNIDVIFTSDISYYKKRKVRVLNGSHTNLVPISLWLGKETVFDVMNDAKLFQFVDNTLTNEIIPFVSDDVSLTTAFANNVKERFKNPYLNHQLTSIALNSISKWKARVLPSFMDYYIVNHHIPKYLTIGFVYLAKIYMSIEKIDDKYICHLPNRNIDMKDDVKNLEYFNDKSLKEFISDSDLWGMDLSTFEGLNEQVNKYLDMINKGEEII